jgi:hypothetical protein
MDHPAGQILAMIRVLQPSAVMITPHSTAIVILYAGSFLPSIFLYQHIS